MAKYLTLGILLVGFIIGVVGSFIITFNMDGYINFLKGFAPLYIALIASIGANSAVEKYKK
jgi:divalent metal cation (Fe/Co/Zn/Cd) transporter